MPWWLVIVIVVVGLWIISRVWRTRFSFRDKVVLITGGSRGLGLVLARQLCEEGAKVAILARDTDELARAKGDLDRRGGEVLTIECDLLDGAQIQSAIRTSLERFRKIDIVINNAGIIEVGPLEQMRLEDFDRAMRIHFWGPFALTMQLLPHLRAQGGGRIVNISSIGGKIGLPHLAAYCASKFALTGFSDSIRAELAKDNIRVTTVAPGLMRTGSHVNAKFKGNHAAEFAWFSVSSGMPLISMKDERAAAKILGACRRGQPSLTLTMAARAAIVANALFPNISAYLGRAVNGFLPQAAGEDKESRRGGDLPRLAPGWTTYLADRATKRNNEGTKSSVT